MQDWLFDAGYEPTQPEAMGAGPVPDGPSLSVLLDEIRTQRGLAMEHALTLALVTDTPPTDSLSPDTQDWIAAFKASAANDSHFPLSGTGYDSPSTDLGEIVVIGDRPWYELYNNWWEVGGSLGGGGPDPWTESGNGGGGEVDDDECPFLEAYEQAADQVGLFAGLLSALKDTPFTMDPRDDRAIDRALFAIDSLDIMLQSQTINYTTLHTTLSSIIEIVLAEGTDHLAAVFGGLAGGAFAAGLDGPVPVGEVIGGMLGALAVYALGDNLPTEEIAGALASVVLTGVDLPEDGQITPCV